MTQQPPFTAETLATPGCAARTGRSRLFVVAGSLHLSRLAAGVPAFLD
jgi:hypothetical protein